VRSGEAQGRCEEAFESRFAEFGGTLEKLVTRKFGYDEVDCEGVAREVGCDRSTAYRAFPRWRHKKIEELQARARAKFGFARIVLNNLGRFKTTRDRLLALLVATMLDARADHSDEVPGSAQFMGDLLDAMAFDRRGPEDWRQGVDDARDRLVAELEKRLAEGPPPVDHASEVWRADSQEWRGPTS
jgi:hypothetical protein